MLSSNLATGQPLHPKVRFGTARLTPPYVPALLVSSALIFWPLTRSPAGQAHATMLAGQH
jgi:hypothetical protein